MISDHHPPILVAWAVVVIIAAVWGIGSHPLMDQDEGRNGEVAREMAATNDCLLPHLNGLPYIDKPLLWFAATAAVMEILGPTELAARSISFICWFVTALLVGIAAGRRFGREPGWVAGIAAASAPLPLAFARIAILDSMLALFVTCSLLAFHAAVEARAGGRRSTGLSAIAWAAIGLGILTKGPVALAIPLLVAAPYAAWRRASWAVWNPLGPLLAAAIAAPWVWYMEARLPGYLEYVAVTETWSRVSSDALRRTEPWWYFLVMGGAGFFPWWFFAIGHRRATDSRRPDRVFAALWLLLPLVLFSLSRSKLPQYILPLMPAVALLVASRWNPRDRPPRLAVTAAVTGTALFGAAMAAAAAGALERAGIHPELAAVMTVPAAIMSVVSLAAAWMAVVSLRRRRGAWLCIALTLPAAALPVVLHPVISALSELRSERALVGFIRSELPAETEVIGYRAWRPSVSFYLRRTVPILSSDGAELRSNYILHTSQRWLDPSGPLRPMPANDEAVFRCEQPRVFLVHSRQAQIQDAMRDAGLEEIWAGPKLYAYFCLEQIPEKESQSLEDPRSPL